MEKDSIVRQQLIKLLKGGQSYRPIEELLSEIPYKIVHLKPEGFPYSIWQLVEHIRIAQWDIVEFSKNSDHVSPKWPDEYWPAEVGPANEQQWNNAIEEILNYRNKFIDLINNSETNVYEAFEWGNGQNMLREVLVLAEHNAYHTGQIILLKKLLV